MNEEHGRGKARLKLLDSQNLTSYKFPSYQS